MTFGLAFLCPEYAGVVTDRRISSSGRRVSDEYNKSGVIDFGNGRLAYTFTGLAEDRRGFDMSRWLPDAVCRAAGPDGEGFGALEVLRDSLDDRFGKLRVRAADRRTSIVLLASCGGQRLLPRHRSFACSATSSRSKAHGSKVCPWCAISNWRSRSSNLATR